jgi:NAD-dependent dihydropyrimidine dehydrogenase PreA subunit
MSDENKTYYMAEVDLTKCGMCQVCVRHCPAKALRAELDDNRLTIYYNPDVCDGCEGEAKCQQQCPEGAIHVERLAAKPDDLSERQFQSSELLLCKACGELYAPVTHAQRVAGKGGAHADGLKDFCSLCRRTNLVVNFVQERRADEAEGKAEYRQGAQLMKKGRMKSKRKVDPEQRPPTPEMETGKGKLPPQ